MEMEEVTEGEELEGRRRSGGEGGQATTAELPEEMVTGRPPTLAPSEIRAQRRCGHE